MEKKLGKCSVQFDTQNDVAKITKFKDKKHNGCVVKSNKRLSGDHVFSLDQVG